MTTGARRIAVADLAGAKAALEADGAALVPVSDPFPGKPSVAILLSEPVADELSVLLGRFGDALTVRIFAAVTLAELGVADIAALVGGDSDDVAAEIGRLEGGGFVIPREAGGETVYGAGNPPLRRFFARRFAPDVKLHP